MRPSLQRQADRPAGRVWRWRGPSAITAGVLMLHAGVLLRPPAGGPPGPPPGAVPMQVRQIIGPPPNTPTDTPTDTPRQPARQPGTARPVRALARSAAQPPSADDTRPSAPSMAVTRASPETSAPAPATPAGEAQPPVYATQVPAPVRLRYALQRGVQQGHATLDWAVDAEGYRLQLRSEVGASGGVPAPGSDSSGRLDAHGLAPDRHTESRRGREVRAANFRRDSARVTFSGPRAELPLMAGAQDRLSWLLQLAAIAEANPDLRAPGAEIQVFVVGSRGDAQTWRCQVVEREDLDLPIGPVPGALHLRREPQRLYDTQVDVWLDPAREHLPVRLRLRAEPGGATSEWRLEALNRP